MNGLVITGVKLERQGDDAVVLVEVNDKWVEVLREPCDACFSHIVEPSGINAILESKD